MAFLLFTKAINKIYVAMCGWLILIIIHNEVQRLPGLGAVLNLRYGSLFIAGICFYKIKSEGDKGAKAYTLLALSYLCTILVLRDVEGSFIAITVIYLLFISAIFVESKMLSSRILIFLGSISYALYLIHQNIGFVIINHVRSMGFTGAYIIAVPVITCTGLAWLITIYIERPIILFLNKQFGTLHK